MDANSIIGDITAVTKKWTRQRKAEERQASAACRRDSHLHARVTVKPAAADDHGGSLPEGRATRHLPPTPGRSCTPPATTSRTHRQAAWTTSTSPRRCCRTT